MSAVAATRITDRRAGRSGQEMGGAVNSSAASPVTFTLPLCPSTNVLFKTLPNGRRAKTAAYDDWRAVAKTALRTQGVPHTPGHVVINMGFEIAGDRADVDNRIKATIDLLVAAGIIDDDKHVVSPLAGKLPHHNGLAHIEIWPSQHLRAEFNPSQDGARGGWVIYAPQHDGEPDGPIA